MPRIAKFRSISLCLMLAALLGVSHARIAVLSELSQFHSVRSGEVVDNRLTISNPEIFDASVRIYQTDYLFYADGSEQYGEPGSVSRSNASWIELSGSDLVVPAGQSVDISYRIRVPEGGEHDGSYWSLIMIEEVVAQEPGSDGKTAVRTLLRYAVQIVTEFGATGESLLNFQNPTLLKGDSGSVQLQIDALNEGERLIRSGFYVELYDATGVLATRVDGRARRTYPGTSVRQLFDLGALSPGQYTAVIVADGGAENLFGAQYTLNIE